jgi:hypothetical protein
VTFPAPPVRTPFQDDKGNISRPWIEWMQKISVQLSTGVPAIAGSRGGNAALASLLTVLAEKGFITDSTTP